MRTRNGLVSNSSSTSFIVPANCKDEAMKLGLELMPIKRLKELFKELEDMGAGFITDYSYRINALNELKDEDFISTPFDRDDAYRLGIDYNTFETDL